MHIKRVISDPKARQKPCVRCGLSLKKHLDERYCPRCGLSVWMSLNQNDSLEYSNPAWLRKASTGAWVLAMAQPLALAAYLVAMLGWGVSEMTRAMNAMAEFDGVDPAGFDAQGIDPAATMPVELSPELAHYLEPAPPSVAIAVALIVIGGYFVFNAIGMVMLVVHERRHPDRMRTVRTTSQVAAGISAGLGVLLMLMAAPKLASGWPVDSISSWLPLLVIEGAFVLCACCCWFYLKRIAQRGGRSGLSRICGYLLFLPVIPLLKGAPLLGLWFLYLLSPLLYLLPLVYIPLSIYLIVRCAILLKKAAPEAEQTWASESVTPTTPVAPG